MATTSNARERSAEPDDGAPAEFEFRLFATDHGGDERVSGQRIVLEDEDEEVGEGGLVHPRRHRSYYFSTLALGPELAAFQHAALSGEDILQLSKSRNFGLEVPWRVRVVKGVGMVTRKRKEGPIGEGCVGVEGQGKRTRAGKKRRIVLRERQRKRVKEEEERKKKGEEKEGREREKRVRRNREKKIKRREKERMEKARKAAGGEGIEQSSS
ncbi:hypothetical protein BJ875DRAFT_506389 [Amylocarpus encephaloides]|uniref:Uncharacterized protein n=1 Tax=Amylocarpus encephaloides TaxID=45428 RepID=A0A9P8C3C2_9HELO|nr:hypothetical protein BJ875DRAFT_506389 [Amylocarpus encephaloides]